MMTEDVKDPGIGLSIQVQVSKNHQIVAQTFVGRDDDVAVLDELLDRVTASIDRQEAKYRLIGLRVDLEVHDAGFARMLKNMEDVEAENRAKWEQGKRTGPYKLSAAERQQKVQAERNKEQWIENRKKLEREIAECEALLKPKRAPLRDVA
jgi:hypothetical protein